MRKIGAGALVLAALSAGVLLPGTAAADTDPALAGDCTKILADVTAVLKVQNLPAEVCATVQGLVNSLSATTQKLLDGAPTVVLPPPPSEIPTPPPPPPPLPQPPPPPAAPAPAPAISTDLDTAAGVSYPLRATAPTSNVAPLSPPLTVQPPTHEPAPPTGTKPGQVPPDAGDVQALPAASRSPAKLPLLLSAIALSVAAAALAHTWLRRRLT